MTIDSIRSHPLFHMMDLVKLAALTFLIVFALYRKVPVGLALFLAGIATAFLFQLPLSDYLSAVGAVVSSDRFIFLTIIVVTINFLGELLRSQGLLERLALSAGQLPGGERTATLLVPMTVGLLPMPGGSRVSAPMVESILKKQSLPPDFLTVANYWFRHTVEFCWPIYPGLILTEGITGMPIGQVSLLQIPLTLVMVLLGWFFLLRGIKPSGERVVELIPALRGMLYGVWPILLAIAIYGVTRIHLAWALLIATAIFLAVARPGSAHLRDGVRHALRPTLLTMIFGVLLFEQVLELSGAIQAFPAAMQAFGFPGELLLFLVPFTIGLLTGMISAFVGLGYVLLATLLYQPELRPDHILIAYLSGYTGMMLSPAHLCLVLTAEYFKTNLRAVYRRLLPPLLLLLGAGILIALSGWPELVKRL